MAILHECNKCSRNSFSQVVAQRFFYAIWPCVQDKCRGGEAPMRLHLGLYNIVQNHLLIAQSTIAGFTHVHRTTDMKYSCIIPCTTRISLTLSFSVLNVSLHILEEHYCTLDLKMILWKSLLFKQPCMPSMVTSVSTLIQVLSHGQNVYVWPQHPRFPLPAELSAVTWEAAVVGTAVVAPLK